jgi:hypothetical protein
MKVTDLPRLLFALVALPLTACVTAPERALCGSEAGAPVAYFVERQLIGGGPQEGYFKYRLLGLDIDRDGKEDDIQETDTASESRFPADDDELVIRLSSSGKTIQKSFPRISVQGLGSRYYLRGVTHIPYQRDKSTPEAKIVVMRIGAHGFKEICSYTRPWPKLRSNNSFKPKPLRGSA